MALLTNEVCEKSVRKFLRKKRKDKLTIYVKDDTVFIEGDADALEFLGNYLIAKAKDTTDDFGSEIGARAAGNIFFNRSSSTHNLYIYRIPLSSAKSTVPS
jgi:hypothetical protein